MVPPGKNPSTYSWSPSTPNTNNDWPRQALDEVMRLTRMRDAVQKQLVGMLGNDALQTGNVAHIPHHLLNK